MKRRALIPLFLLLIVFGGVCAPAAAQDGGSTRAVITPENADQVVELARIGRGTISKVTWSPDGKTIAVAGSLGVWLHDADDLSAPPRLFEGHTGVVLDVAFSPNGNLIASASEDGTARVWNVATGEIVFSTPALETPVTGSTAPVQDVAFSPDGQILAVAGDRVHLWDVQMQTELPSLPDDFCKYFMPKALAFSPDDQRLACAASIFPFSDYSGGDTWVWNLRSEAIEPLLRHDPYWPTEDVAFSPDGSLLASARMIFWVGDERPPRLLVWNMPDGDLRQETIAVPFQSYMASPKQISFNQNGNLIAVACSDGLFFANPLTGEMGDIWLQDQQVDGVAFSPVEDRLAYVTQNTLHLREMNSGEEQTFVYDFPANSIAISPDEQFIALARGNGAVEMRDSSTGEIIKTLLDPGSYSTYAVTFSPDGTLLAAARIDLSTLPESAGSALETGQINIWDVPEGTQVANLPLFIPDRIPPDITFDPESLQLFYSCAAENESENQPIWAWNRIKDTVGLTDLWSLDSCATHIALGGPIIAATTNTTIELIDTRTGEGGLNYEPDGIFVDLAVHPSGSPLAFSLYYSMLGGGNTKLYLLPLDSDQSPIELVDPSAPTLNVTTSIAFSPDGSLLIDGSGDDYLQTNARLRIWDVENRSLLATLTGHPQTINDVAFSADGTLIVTAGQDGTIRLWGIPPGD